MVGIFSCAEIGGTFFVTKKEFVWVWQCLKHCSTEAFLSLALFSANRTKHSNLFLWKFENSLVLLSTWQCQGFYFFLHPLNSRSIETTLLTQWCWLNVLSIATKWIESKRNCRQKGNYDSLKSGLTLLTIPFRLMNHYVELRHWLWVCGTFVSQANSTFKRNTASNGKSMKGNKWVIFQKIPNHIQWVAELRMAKSKTWFLFCFCSMFSGKENPCWLSLRFTFQSNTHYTPYESKSSDVLIRARKTAA